MENENTTKTYFLPGDVVTLRQDIPNKPKMVVVKKVDKKIKISDSVTNFFQGILCRSFTTNGELQESIFNTKDLIKL